MRVAKIKAQAFKRSLYKNRLWVEKNNTISFSLKEFKAASDKNEVQQIH